PGLRPRGVHPWPRKRAPGSVHADRITASARHHLPQGRGLVEPTPSTPPFLRWTVLVLRRRALEGPTDQQGRAHGNGSPSLAASVDPFRSSWPRPPGCRLPKPTLTLEVAAQQVLWKRAPRADAVRPHRARTV